VTSEWTDVAASTFPNMYQLLRKLCKHVMF